MPPSLGARGGLEGCRQPCGHCVPTAVLVQGAVSALCAVQAGGAVGPGYRRCCRHNSQSPHLRCSVTFLSLAPRPSCHSRSVLVS